LLGIVALVVIGVFVLIAFIPGMTLERQVDVSKDMISVSGVWGTEIKMEQIDKVNLQNELLYQKNTK